MKTRTIWSDNDRPDTYAEFISSFSVEEIRDISLQIGFDSHAAVYINEKLAFFGAAADYPWYRLCDKVDITEYCRQQNDIRILVWHHGVDSQTYIKGKAGLAFSVEQAGRILLKSGSHILARQNVCYRNGYCKNITTQLGLSFYYDNTARNELPFMPCVESEEKYEFHIRKTGCLELGGRIPVAYYKTEHGYLIDMKEEIVGFLELEFVSSIEQEILISYGEHLVDGHVPQHIGDRDFSVEFKARKGDNHFLNPFRRLAGRYLEVSCEEPLEITYIGLRPTDRRVKEIRRSFEDPLLQRIYDVSVNTLKKCMHEHYEDCPWREQAMYALDSRNQMLCGYYAFKGQDFQKENLLFIAKGQREDGLLSLCFPTGIDIPIPFFSLVYIMQVHEYVQFTKDFETAAELKPVIERIRRAFQERVDTNGLIPNFPYPYWNFYEWAVESSNESEIERTPDEPYVKQYDMILNSMYVYFCRIYEELYGKRDVAGENPEADGMWQEDSMLVAIHNTFYDEERGLYRLSTKGKAYSQLGNSFAILIGLGSRALAEKLVNDKTLIEVTLSMNTFYYDALLTCGEAYEEFIIWDIKEKYGYMLEQGATTFWETAKGWQDFDGAGSLCHGWSAIPAYYLPRLLT